MRNSVKGVISRLEEIESQVAEYLDTAESAEYPNEERVERLQDELDKITEAKDILEEIE